MPESPSLLTPTATMAFEPYSTDFTLTRPPLCVARTPVASVTRLIALATSSAAVPARKLKVSVPILPDTLITASARRTLPPVEPVLAVAVASTPLA